MARTKTVEQTHAAEQTRTAEPRGARLRADAFRNRERIVAVAREALVEYGIEVPFDEIARRAGIGNATLYRHFPDRRRLVSTVVLSVLTRTADEAEAALAEEPDAFQALRRFVHTAADERVGALCPLLSDGFDKDAPDFVAARARLDRSVGHLVDAAHRSGLLRPDVAIGDLMLAVTQLARPLPGTGCVDIDRFTHRHLDVYLDGLHHSSQRSVLPGTAATLDDLRQCRIATGARHA